MRHYSFPIFCCHLWFFICAVVLQSKAFAGGTELFPGNFEPFAAGTNIVSFFQYNRQLAGYYVDGHQILGGAKIKAHAEVLGYTHYTKLGDYTSAIGLLLPYITARQTEGILPPGHGEHFSGWSDPRLMLSVWPVENDQRSIALSTTLFLPIGEYKDTQAINTGDHRWKATMQTAWIERLSESIKLELIPEVTIYETNNSYVKREMSQAPSYALTSFLRWRILPMLETQVGYQFNDGGEQTINGIKQDNETQIKRFFAGFTTGLSKNFLIGFRYARDSSVNYELKTTSDFVLNMHYIF